MSEKIILAIETSCDETAAAVYCGTNELSSIVNSQIEIHGQFGGVVPEIASRNHLMMLPHVVKQALLKANLVFQDLECIACTFGAGLQGALLTGLSYAKALAYSLNIPLIPINHIQAHIATNFLSVLPPFLCLVVSGGHTSIVEVLDFDKFSVLSSTADDAMGECFDKVARVLNLGYPGGPSIEKAGQGHKANINFFKNARTKNSVLSFSGLKTASVNYIRQRQSDGKLSEQQVGNICASFSKAAIEIVVSNTFKYAKQKSYKSIALAGGVAANKDLQASLIEQATQQGMIVHCPQLKYCTDNAAMVALCCHFQNAHNYMTVNNPSYLNLNVESNLSIETMYKHCKN
ncbi:MAG: tRNA (adenosine(37)-N6)-threonylcarbamoyltransferase complex transferase subunit TsaD [Clostridiales bacterium]|nr:tRNA (adenosine(37)-N6)-threonylcarbamoyltransferase complex transferase subunit TsaD [Clostridiales bacterium]